MMRLYVILALALSGLFLISSCDNSLNLVEKGENVPIVYSLLSSSSDQQYIRVEQGFIDALKPAQEIAQIEDSVYYNSDVTVKLINLNTNNTFELEKTNASDIGFNREEGFFPTDPNYIYLHSGTEDDFKPGDKVRFELDRGEDFNVVFTEIDLLDTLLITKPLTTQEVSIPDLADFTIKWVLSGDILPDAYTINLIIHYEEANQEDDEPEFEPKMVKWKFADVRDERFAGVPGKEFFQFLETELEEDPKYVRTFEWFDVELIYTGQEVKKYNDFLNANTGITSSQPLPPYTNLSEGLGLVGERNTQYVRRVYLKAASLDSLSNGRYTKDLGFL